MTRRLQAKSDKLRVLDLFSGIGGFALGLERAGHRTAAFCEISPKCRHLLNHHWPEVPAYDDVCTLTAERLAADGVAVDAICGGFPCQDISDAGERVGIAGERSGLWSQYARLVRELRPRIVIVENVAALASRGLGVVLGDLAAIGYDAWWDCIRASDVGAPHLRKRLWIVAYPRSLEHQGYGDALSRAVAEELPLAIAELAYANGGGRKGSEPTLSAGVRRRSAHPGKAVADAPCKLLDGSGNAGPGRGREPTDRGWWATEPDLGRVAHGVPARVDRLHGLGNAVVPEIPYRLGRAISAALAHQAEAA